MAPGSAGVGVEHVCAVWRVFGIEGCVRGRGRGGGRALGLLHALARGPYGRDLLLLRGERAERLRDQVRVRRDHVLPPGRVHHVSRVTPVTTTNTTITFKFFFFVSV